MSIMAPPPNRFTWKYSNFDAPSTTPGTSITPGASNAEGTFTQIASGANIANDVYGILLWVAGGNTSTAQKSHLLDIGYDPTGGTTYTTKIPVANLVCGQSSAALNGGCWFWLPLFIPAGSAVAVRIQGNNATAGTVRVGATFYGRPTRPELVRAATFTETIGAITNSSGVSFTPGTSGAEGSWVSLGTTTKDLWYWVLGVQIDNGTTTSLVYAIDLAYGDASNKHMIIQNLQMLLPGTAEQTTIIPPLREGACEVPGGSTIYVRGSCSGAPVTGFNAVAIGFGG